MHVHHGDTEVTEISSGKLYRMTLLCVLCVSVVSTSWSQEAATTYSEQRR